jgi:hypothetical protein
LIIYENAKGEGEEGNADYSIIGSETGNIISPEKQKTQLENAIEKLQKLTISGYIQAQYQYAQSERPLGIIGAALIVSHSMGFEYGIGSISELPVWVALCCHIAIALGTMSGGWSNQTTFSRPLGNYKKTSYGVDINDSCKRPARRTDLFNSTFVYVKTNTTDSINKTNKR